MSKINLILICYPYIFVIYGVQVFRYLSKEFLCKFFYKIKLYSIPKKKIKIKVLPEKIQKENFTFCQSLLIFLRLCHLFYYYLNWGHQIWFYKDKIMTDQNIYKKKSNSKNDFNNKIK